MEPEKAALTPREKKLLKNLTGLYTGVGAIVAGLRSLPGQIIMGSAAARAEEVVRFARHHKDVLEALEKLVESNDTFNMIVGHGAMLFAILVSLDRIKVGPRSAAILQATGYDQVVNIKLQEAGVPDGSEAVAA